MRLSLFILLATLSLVAPAAHAVRVADVTRISGQRTNLLTGLGLVVGLKGTGDGGDFMPAIRPLATMLSKFNEPATVKELGDANNVAVVSITATVPKDGVRDGDQLDVIVQSIGAAASLRGGYLFVTPMQGPLPGSGIFALASGPVTLEDPTTPTVGRVPDGLTMEADLPAQYIDNGRFTLVVDDAAASWTTASTIAKIINDAEGEDGHLLAVAVDPKNVVVSIPHVERDRPDSFISRVQMLPLQPQQIATEARVQVNEKAGSLVITGDVEISPVVISYKGLTITTVTPTPQPTVVNPQVRTTEAVALDTSGKGGSRLQDLVDTLDRIKVPAADRIAIVKELHKTGRLHAKLIVE